MRYPCGCRTPAAIAGFALVCFCPQLGASTETLRSSALELEVTTSPYSYRVLERAGGKVLLSHSALAFTEKDLRVASATNVSKSADSLRATLELANGAGTAHVTFTFTSPQVIQVLVTYDQGDPGVISEEFNDQGEHYYGIWEYNAEGIDNRGLDQDFIGLRPVGWQLRSGPRRGGRRNGPRRGPRGPGQAVNWSSARAPFYVTSGHYGIYVESEAQGHYKLAVNSKTSFSFHDSKLKYDIIYGPTYADVFQRYNAMAGPAFFPPDWAFGSYWWRDDHHSDLRGVDNAQEKVIDDADQLRRLKIPASVIWIDRPYGTGTMGWGNMDFDKSFPDPAKMVSDLKDRGMHLLLWIADRSFNNLYTEGTEKGYLFTEKDGVAESTGPAVDLRNPAAYAWLKAKMKPLVDVGVQGWKLDRGEEHALPDSFMNQHAILYNKLAAEALAQAYGKDYVVLSRNANDTSRKYTTIWNGDTRATFAGLAISVKGGLRCGAINFPIWGSDTGGYIGIPDKELFSRWLEFSAYSPTMEVLLGPRRTIWQDYDSALTDITRRQVTAHHDLIPYTRSYMYEAEQTGMPIMRSIIFAYPNETSQANTWDEYMYGDEILVAPVTEAGVTSRRVYLPAGRWIDYNDKTTIHNGGASLDAKAPLGAIPLFVREGAIIPRGDILKADNNWEPNWKPNLHIEFFPSARRASTFDYYTGSAARHIAASVTKSGIAVSVEDLGVGGDLEVYCRGVKGVTSNGVKLKEGAGYRYDGATGKLTVPFSGATTLAIEGAASVFGS